MKRKSLSTLIIIVILLIISSCSFNKLAEEDQNDLTDINFDMTTKHDDRKWLSFIDATIISIDSIPKGNLKKISNSKFIKKINSFFRTKTIEVELFSALDSSKHIILNVKLIINEEILFIVGLIIEGKFYYKKLYSVISNTIICCKNNIDYFNFYGEFLTTNNNNVFYEFSYFFKNKSFLVTKPDFYFFIDLLTY